MIWVLAPALCKFGILEGDTDSYMLPFSPFYSSVFRKDEGKQNLCTYLLAVKYRDRGPEKGDNALD